MNKGFSLIEVLIYFALCGFIVTGSVVSVYSIAEAQSRSEVRALLSEEGNYVLEKIGWMVSQNIPFTCTLLGSDLLLARASNPPQVINNGNTEVSNFSLVYGTSTKISFTLTSRTPQGVLLSEEFSATQYPYHE